MSYLIVTILFLIGVALGLLIMYQYFMHLKDGAFLVNLNDPYDDTFKLVINRSIEEIPKCKYLIFKVEKKG